MTIILAFEILMPRRGWRALRVPQTVCTVLCSALLHGERRAFYFGMMVPGSFSFLTGLNQGFLSLVVLVAGGLSKNQFGKGEKMEKELQICSSYSTNTSPFFRAESRCNRKREKSSRDVVQRPRKKIRQRFPFPVLKERKRNGLTRSPYVSNKCRIFPVIIVIHVIKSRTIRS